MISEAQGEELTDKRRKTVISKAQWSQIMVRSLRGEDDKSLCAEFGMSANSLRQQRYNNPGWQAAHDEIKALRNAKNEAPKPVVKVVQGTLSIKEIIDSHPSLIANFAQGKIREAIEGETLPAIESWSDLKTAIEIVRKACGMDNQTTNVQVNLWSGAAQSGPSVIIDAQTSPVEPVRESENECSTVESEEQMDDSAQSVESKGITP